VNTLRKTATAIALVLSAALPASAGSGELSLDRAALTEIVRAGIPGPIPIEIPNLGAFHLSLSSPGTIELIGGGIEIPVGFAIAEIGLSGTLRVRYEPSIDPKDGSILLVPRKATPQAPISLPLDLSPILPPARLPREIEWDLGAERGSPGLAVRPESVRVLDDRLVIRFRLDARSSGSAELR
jgi:hypothetical protein